MAHPSDTCCAPCGRGLSETEAVLESLREELAGAPVGLAADIAAHARLASDRVLAVDADHVLERVCGTCQCGDSIGASHAKEEDANEAGLL
jgi:hypothetical protein